MLLIKWHLRLQRCAMMRSFDDIFLMIRFMQEYSRLWAYWFFQFSSREWRRWRPGAYAARVQITQTHPVLTLPPPPPPPPIFLIHSSFQCPLSSITLSALHPHFLIGATPPEACHYVIPLPLSLFHHSSLILSSHFCPLQRPSLARQGWLQIRSTVPWGYPMGSRMG